jgi:site-specific DNA-adenine methylase
MPKQCLLFGRLGNKQNEIKYFKSLLPTENIENIVEPFGGSFAVIRNIYNDDKYNKFVNDTDLNLYYIYTHPTEYKDFKIQMNNIAKTFLNENNNVKFDEFIVYINSLTDLNTYLLEFWKKEKIIRSRCVKTFKNEQLYDDHLLLTKKINFSCDDWLDVVNRHSKNEKTFIFLDPPYLFSDNTCYMQQYRKTNEDISDIPVKILDIFKNIETKAKIMLVINDLKILRSLFNGYVKFEYIKKYSISNRCESIIVICNY